MKLLTITIPCYNSQDYMEKSICSALTGGDRVEIIIVDDGSSDNTLQIAKKYEEKFPNIVRVIHQENGEKGNSHDNSYPVIGQPAVTALHCRVDCHRHGLCLSWNISG